MTDDINEILSEQIEEVQKTFSLEDALVGRGMVEVDFTAYTDEVGAEAISELDKDILKLKIAGNEEEADTLTAKKAQVEEKIKQSAIIISLRSLPNIAIKKIKRDARKGYTDKKGNVDNDRLEDFADNFTAHLLAHMITKVTRADGAVMEEDFRDVEKVKLFQNYLPISEWKRLDEQISEIQFKDKFAQGLALSPDFSLSI